MKTPISLLSAIGTFRIAEVIVLVAAGLTVAGCAQTQVKEEEFSGFLGDYSDFEEMEAGDGFQVVGWISPDLRGNYNAIILNPVTIYPPRQTFERVDEEAVAESLAYLNRRLREEVGKQIKLVNEPGSGVLQFRAAITTVEAGFKPLKWYQFMPITAAVTVAGEATGVRAEAVQLIAESELIDTRKGVRVGASIRLGSGKVGTDEPIELANLEPVFDEWAESAGLWVAKHLN